MLKYACDVRGTRIFIDTDVFTVYYFYCRTMKPVEFVINLIKDYVTIAHELYTIIVTIDTRRVKRVLPLDA